MVEGILETDLGAPRKQRHIPKRICLRTVAKRGYADPFPPCKGSSESSGSLG